MPATMPCGGAVLRTSLAIVAMMRLRVVLGGLRIDMSREGGDGARRDGAALPVRKPPTRRRPACIDAKPKVHPLPQIRDTESLSPRREICTL